MTKAFAECNEDRTFTLAGNLSRFHGQLSTGCRLFRVAPVDNVTEKAPRR